ncbi:hypothetical protein Pcaca04_10860 [Pectobacterium carotovorum subsp. carotovorum]|nr:hypothetical protein Pcaca04_10860 [Pectobacterium carotovorum subsp. carotovorum]
MLDSIFSSYFNAMIFLAFLTFIIGRHALKNPESDFVRKWSNKLRSGHGNMLFLMISISWASAVSVFGSDIKSQIFGVQSLSWETLSFFSTIYATIIVGIYHYIGQQRKERENQARPPLKSIQLSATDIVDINGSLHTCILDWQAILSKNTLYNECETFEKSLRSAKKMCLHSLLSIAESWDEKNNDNVIYRANVFNLAPSSGVMKEFERNDIVGPKPQNGGYSFNIRSVNDSPFFLFNDNWRSKLEKSDFILVNEQDLSVSLPETTELQAGTPICMPYSEPTSPTDSEQKQPNIHGAPLARELKRPVYIPDLKSQVTSTISDLEISPRHREHINDRFKNGLYKYYESDSTRSILSIPIYKFDIGQPFSSLGTIDKPERDDKNIVCVVNLYANKSHIFNNEDMANAYCDLVKPITHVFSILVSIRLSLIELQDMLAKPDYNCGVNDISKEVI